MDMVKQVNENVTCVISGYELLVDILNNHEKEIRELKSRFTVLNPSFVNSEINNDVTCTITNDDLVSSSKIPVAENIDILSLSNVETYAETYIENVQHIPKPSYIAPTELSKTFNVDNALDLSDISSQEYYDGSSCNSSVSKSLDTDYTQESNVSSYSDSHSNKSLSDSHESSDSESLKTDINSPNDILRMSESFERPVSNPNIIHLPYELHDTQLFDLFEVSKLDESTVFTHLFNNRSTSYYGTYPYSYGSTVHQPRRFSENPYLEKVLSYVEIVYPTLRFNSAMVSKYKSGDDFIPQHSDNEAEIEDNSLILTISLGVSRSFEIKELGGSGWKDILRLNHGDSLLMSQRSQKYFSHGVPKENQEGMRLSITLRLIKTRQDSNDMKEIGTQTMNNEFVAVQKSTPLDTKEVQLNNQFESSQSTQRIPDTLGSLFDDPFEDGYQPEQQVRDHHPNNLPRSQIARIGYQKQTGDGVPRLQNRNIDTVYISSSMFRYLDPNRLSSDQQTAEVLYYPGADAAQMLERVTRDPRFIALDKKRVKKVFVMTGTNNVDRVYNGTCLFTKLKDDISDLLYRLWVLFGNAELNVINLLPRQDPAKNSIVTEINQYLKKLCLDHGVKFVNTELEENHFFSHINGVRKSELFSKGYDNVHLSGRGYGVLANYLKYLAHT